MVLTAALGFRHPQIQRLRRLVGRRSARLDERRFVIEGPKAIQEAMEAGAALEAVYVESGEGSTWTDLDRVRSAGVHIVELEPGVIARVASTETPQPVLAVAPFVDVGIETLASATFVVICLDIRDPGNLGTLLRSARATGADGVICTAGSVDLYNPKTVRASAGSLFHVPVVAGGNPVEVLERVGGFGLRRLGATVHGGDDPQAADLQSPLALVLGNEAHGLADVTSLDGCLTIPMPGGTESLNVAMAGTVLCFDVARQRRGNSGV